MIIGIGIDIVNIQRIEKAITNLGNCFLQRIFTSQEIERCQRRINCAKSFAKIFAAKEATIKAIGQTKGISWQNIEVFKEKTGKPHIKLYEKALYNLQSLTKAQDFNVHLSLSDDYPYATAFVIIEIMQIQAASD